MRATVQLGSAPGAHAFWHCRFHKHPREDLTEALTGYDSAFSSERHHSKWMDEEVMISSMFYVCNRVRKHTHRGAWQQLDR